ncbi:MAG: nuclear transport factor 2 family protein, partial [Lutibacter sp.]|nr:nuclear transport factor 2 family protein [Lutibacter sp.]
HNDRDLEKIAEINADDWKGYTADGSQLKGNKAHIEVLDNWFKTANPRWEIKWMIANAAENEDGVLTQWLTTGNDYFDTDQNGNEIFQHNIHDIKFVDGKIKEIYVYSREKAKDSSDFSY